VEDRNSGNTPDSKSKKLSNGGLLDR